jgi:large subunit ribosomal protein L35
MKTVKGAVKRFKPTATGKLKRKKALFNHILTKKSANRKRRLAKSTLVTTRGDVKRIKRMLGS